MPRKLSDADADDLVRRYLAGESTKQLGPAFGVSSRAVSDYLKRAGVQARPRYLGVVEWQASLTHEQRSAKSSAAMLKRWENAGEAERAAMLEPAHAATRGVPLSEERKERIARTRAERNRSQSVYEAAFAAWLTERGVSFVQQEAVGPYNLDFAVGHTAVEITTGWARKKEWKPRLAYLFDRGWDLYVVWHDVRVPLNPAIADDFVAWRKVLDGAPAEGGQYRVIWSRTQLTASGRADADDLAGVLRRGPGYRTGT